MAPKIGRSGASPAVFPAAPIRSTPGDTEVAPNTPAPDCDSYTTAPPRGYVTFHPYAPAIRQGFVEKVADMARAGAKFESIGYALYESDRNRNGRVEHSEEGPLTALGRAARKCGERTRDAEVKAGSTVAEATESAKSVVRKMLQRNLDDPAFYEKNFPAKTKRKP